MPPDTQLLSPSRRNFLKALGMTAAIGLINACTNDGATATTAAGGTGGTGSTAATGGSGAGNFPETPAWEFVFVNHVTTNPFFVPTVYGIEDAAAILGIPTPQWTGSEDRRQRGDGQRHGGRHRRRSRRDRRLPGRPRGLQRAHRRGPGRGNPGHRLQRRHPTAPNNRLCYVGQDLYGSGFAMGKRIVELVGPGRSRCSSPPRGSSTSSPASTVPWPRSPSRVPISRRSTSPPGPPWKRS